MAKSSSSETRPEKIVPREYQLELLESAIEKNIIVCLGTGTGKTFISIKLIEHLARKHDIIRPFSKGAKRTFFLVNSVPLAFQQAKAIELHTALKVKAFCGEMGVDFWSKDDEWAKHFEENHVLVMTHQIYLDLLLHAKIELNRANLLVFDECHHANKKHPFKKIMDCFPKKDYPKEDYPRILGLTASVVGKKVKPHQIPSEVKALESTMRCKCETASDPNVVEKYGAKPKENIKRYFSSEHSDGVANYLEAEFRSILNPLQEFLTNVQVKDKLGGPEGVTAKLLSVLKGNIRECATALDEIGVWAAYEVSMMLVSDLEKQCKRAVGKWAALFFEATLTSLRHVCGIYKEFNLANQSTIKVQQHLLKPKVKELLKLFEKGDPSICSIVFVERRYAACVVSKLINQLADTDPDYQHLSSNFVTGHGADIRGISETEMKFTEQNKTLQEFRDGKFNVLVGTSVVEEGVDIPKCNLVVMFDFPKNYRAFVQSRGRGRAKDAQYILLVNGSEYIEKRQEQEMYQDIDEYLARMCREKRPSPTNEESNDAVNIDPLPPYYTSINAKVDMGSAIGLLHRYCQMLPCDRFTMLKPKFSFRDHGEKFQCTLQMPGNSLITGLIKGEPMQSKDEAKQAVAIKACIQLHKEGALNDNLLPVGNSSDSESEDVDGTDGSRAKTGTKKRQRRHNIKVAQDLEGELSAKQTVYVYAIKMKVIQVFKGTLSKTRKELWDKKKHVFGIVTNNQLPQLPPFSLYHKIGKVAVDLEHCLTQDNLTPKQLRLINWFHQFIFKEALYFEGSTTRSGCRVVLLSFNNVRSPSMSNKRPFSPIEITEINFEEMKRLKRKTKHWNINISSDTDFTDAVVAIPYKEKTFNVRDGDSQSCDIEACPSYLVTAVETHLNPRSPFPDPTRARTFKEYFHNRYKLTITNDKQPLVQLVHFRIEIDCRYREERTTTSTKHIKEQHFIPETLRLKKCPQSILLRANLLPSVLYRVQNLLAMLELHDTIATEAGVGIVPIATLCSTDVLSFNEDPEESPIKKSKFGQFSNGERTLSEMSSDDDDMPSFQHQNSQSPSKHQKNFLSTLKKYFTPFDRSRYVPLINLLEAVTCASSSDEFNLERLEMLGDSFLKMAVSIYVYWHENHKDEGKLTKYRTRQISNKNLFNLALRKGIPGYVKYDRLLKTTWSPPGFTLPGEGGKNGEVRMETGDESLFHSGDASQMLPDKSIADSTEALIGAHLTHCGYMATLKVMSWLGLKVLAEDEQNTGIQSSSYANYPRPSFDIPEGEDGEMYRNVLKQETKEMASFEKDIGYVFKNKVLLLEAFTHPTYSDNTITGSYQRLEFLGDAILDFLVTQHIYNHCGKRLTPGSLTDLRSALVNNNIFATIAVENNYHKYLKEYSPQLFTNIGSFVKAVEEYQKEFKNKANPDPYVIAVQDETSECIEAPKPLGDVFESVAGAIFLDSGLDICTVWKVCYSMLKKYIDEYSKDVPRNPIRGVMEFDSGAKFIMAKITDEGKVSCDLTFTEDKAKEIGQRVFQGVGRNKHNAKLSAAYKAMKKRSVIQRNRKK